MGYLKRHLRHLTPLVKVLAITRLSDRNYSTHPPYGILAKHTENAIQFYPITFVHSQYFRRQHFIIDLIFFLYAIALQARPSSSLQAPHAHIYQYWSSLHVPRHTLIKTATDWNGLPLRITAINLSIVVFKFSNWPFIYFVTVSDSAPSSHIPPHM